MESDLQKLSDAFNGDAKTKLNKIYDNLENQSKKSSDLANSIDEFLKNSNKYINDVSKISSTFESFENKIRALNEIEAKAQEQMRKLDTLIEEKKINYNVKDLERALDVYNNNVQKVSDFINKDVAQSLNDTSRKIDAIKKDSDALSKQIKDEHSSVEELIQTYSSTNSLLKNLVEKEDVNEAYIYAILDKWANDRGVKRKN
jgi:chromosome segregation ATPase